jgi:predicted RND superfamily exporter protein
LREINSTQMNKPLFRERVTRWMSRLITGHPGWVITTALLLGLFFWSFLPRVTFRPDVDDFLATQDPSFILRENLRSLFPNNEFIVIAFQSDDLFTAENLGVLQQLTEDLEGLELVKDVKSLATITDMVGEDDAFSVAPFLDSIPSDPADLEALHRRAVENPLYVDRLISQDGRTTGIVVFTRTEDIESPQRGELIRDIRAVLEPYESRGYRFHLAGWPVTNYFLALSMKEDLVRFSPITLLLVVGTIWLVFRNVRLLLLASVGILATVAATLGLTSVLGVSLNNASAAVIPIVIALALSDNVHLFSSLNADVLRQFPDRKAALTHVLDQILFPCLLTSINTAIGFFSLSLSGIPAIQAFGWLAGAGMIFEFIFTFGIVAPLLLTFRTETIYRQTVVHQRRLIPRLLRWIFGVVSRNPRFTLFLCGLILAWGAWECRQLRAETDLIANFKSSAQVRQDAEFVKDHLAGIMPFDLFLEGDTAGLFREPAALQSMERLQNKVKRIPGVDTATSLVDYFNEMNKSFHNEDPAYYRPTSSRRMADQYLLLYNADELEDFVTPDYRHARIVLRLKSTSTRVNAEVLKEVERLIREEPFPGIQVRVSGDGPVHIETARVLVGEQVRNVFSAVFWIWVVMAVVLRSLGMAGFFLVPNLFPIAVNFGIMGAFGIPLDSGTSLVAAAAFGIIVDDTVHFFTRFQDVRAKGLPYFRALEEVSLEKGEASTSSFLVLCIGFGVLTLSGFLPIMYFGLLNGVVLLVGFIGDQFLLKSVLVLWGKKKHSLSASPSFS